MIEAYPLSYPVGWKRTLNPESARFGNHSIEYARDMVIVELERLGATDVILSSNMQVRKDGLIRSGQRQPQDTGVAVYFRLKGENQCFPCDRWDKVEHNLWAIYKSIEAIRGLERWGAKDMVNAAFKGFQALPDYSGSINYFEGCSTDSEIETRWKVLRKKHHPDLGGDGEVFAEANRQYQALKE